MNILQFSNTCIFRCWYFQLAVLRSHYLRIILKLNGQLKTLLLSVLIGNCAKIVFPRQPSVNSSYSYQHSARWKVKHKDFQESNTHTHAYRYTRQASFFGLYALKPQLIVSIDQYGHIWWEYVAPAAKEVQPKHPGVCARQVSLYM